MGRPLLQVTELREVERRAAAALPAGTLMDRAGAAAARRIGRALPSTAAPVLILCGPGNNGGDGYVCARALRAQGRDVVCWAPLAPTAADAQAAQAAWLRSGGSIATDWPPGDRAGGPRPAPTTYSLVVDALFGIGMSRPLAAPFNAPLAWLESRPAPVVALDVPSGLDADTGAWIGGCRGVEADRTITFIADKPGLHTLDGCDAAGAVDVESLGVDAGAARIELLAVDDFPALCRRRPRNSHKGSFGDVWIVGGGHGMVGAVLLAGRAALRLGAGRVYADCIGAPEWRVDPVAPELMFRPLRDGARADALVIGCGLGRDAAASEALAAALERPAQVVVADADALNLIAADAAIHRRFVSLGATRIVTPHPLEAARLLGRDVAQVQADRVHAARDLAGSSGAIAVLKGAGSIVATPDGRAWINPTGSPALATPGSGDALAGIIAALAAQVDDPLQAVLAATWLHGAAGDEHGADSGLVAGEIAALAAKVLARVRAERHSGGR